MRLRSLLPIAAGLSALLLAGCGTDDDALIPQRDADTLSALVADAGSAASAGDCDASRRTVREAEQQLSALPPTTSRRLKANLRDWLDHLDARIAEECRAEPERTPSPEPTASPTATPTPTPTATPSPSPTASPTVSPSPTVDPGTGGQEAPEEPSGSGGVPSSEDTG